jgi:hypothetical protein
MKAPTFPRTDTLTARALMRLLTGQQFTHRDFQNETSSYRLSGYIEQLRNRHGWPIETKDETSLIRGAVPRIVTYARYFIEAEDLAALRAEFGERLDKFIGAVQMLEAGAAATAHTQNKQQIGQG